MILARAVTAFDADHPVDSLRHTFARSYLVNGGDAFSLQRILGHTTLDMDKRYVSLADADLSARHRVASPADRLIGNRGR